MDSDKLGLVFRSGEKGPSHGFRNVVKFQVQENAGARYAPNGFEDLRTLAHEKLEAHFEKTDSVFEKSDVLHSLIASRHVQREDDVVFALLHKNAPRWQVVCGQSAVV
jgi:hypothetical protein